MNWKLHIRCALLLVITLASATLAQASGETVEDFLKLKSKWDELIGSKFLIQGRVAGTTDNVLGLQGCSLEFRAKEKLPRFDVKKDVIEVAGELARDDRTGAIYFKLASYKKLDSDDRIFERRRVELNRLSSQPWYELGDWAVSRGTFYKDTELVQKGKQCYDEALRIERATMKERTIEALQELGRKSVELTGKDTLKQQLTHEAAHLRWSEAMKSRATADELYGLAMNLARDWPGSNQPLVAADQPLRTEYLQSPVDCFDKTISNPQLSNEQREARCRKIYRVMFSELVLESLKHRMKKDGSNGKSVAAELLRVLPEYSDLAVGYRDAEYASRLVAVDKMSFTEMSALRKELAELGRTEDSKDLLVRWFTKREEVLKKQDAAGLVELAALYHVGYEGPRDRRRIIIDLLMEAERQRPGIEEAKTLFAAYGYRQYEGRWMTEQEISAIENSPTAIAMREGRVIPGMTRQQVRKTLGAPTHVTKLLSSKHVTEYWVYRESRFSVKLSRTTSQSEPIVMTIEELPGQ